MQVRLERVDPHIAGQAVVTIRAHHRVRRNFQFVVGQVTDRHRPHLVLRHKALRIEFQGQRGVVALFGSPGVIVHVPGNPVSALFEQPPRVLRESIAVFPDRVFDQQRPAVPFRRAGVVNINHAVMDDLPVAWPHLHGLYPAVFGQCDLGKLVNPPVRPFRVHLKIVRRGLHLRCSHHPEHLAILRHIGGINRRRRHLGRIALQRTLVHPLHDYRNLLIAERNIVGEFADANRLVDVPRRHVSGSDALLNRLRPRPHVVVSQERHRRGSARVMAAVAFRLHDGGDIFAEGQLPWACGFRGERGQRQSGADRRHSRRCNIEIKDSAFHGPVLPYPPSDRAQRSPRMTPCPLYFPPTVTLICALVQQHW